MQELASIFAIDLCAYVVMHNHMRIVIESIARLANKEDGRGFTVSEFARSLTIITNSGIPSTTCPDLLRLTKLRAGIRP